MKTFSRLATFLIVAMSLVLAGCGSTAEDSSFVNTPQFPVATTAPVQLNFVLERAVPSNVTDFRFTARNSQGGITFGPMTMPKQTPVTLTLPVSSTVLMGELLSGSSVVGSFSVPLDLQPGELFIIDDPDFTTDGTSPSAIFQLNSPPTGLNQDSPVVRLQDNFFVLGYEASDDSFGSRLEHYVETYSVSGFGLAPQSLGNARVNPTINGGVFDILMEDSGDYTVVFGSRSNGQTIPPQNDIYVTQFSRANPASPALSEFRVVQETGLFQAAHAFPTPGDLGLFHLNHDAEIADDDTRQYFEARDRENLTTVTLNERPLEDSIGISFGDSVVTPDNRYLLVAGGSRLQVFDDEGTLLPGNSTLDLTELTGTGRIRAVDVTPENGGTYNVVIATTDLNEESLVDSQFMTLTLNPQSGFENAGQLQRVSHLPVVSPGERTFSDSPEVVFRPDGTLLVAYRARVFDEEQGFDTLDAVFIRAFSFQQTSLGGEFRVSAPGSGTLQSGNFAFGDITIDMDAAGNFIVAYSRGEFPQRKVEFRLFPNLFTP